MSLQNAKKIGKPLSTHGELYLLEMPYKESPYFDTPHKQKKIWRYMSIEKFIAMLKKNSLYFPNLSLFSDKKEGTLTEKSKEEVYKTSLLNEENTPILQDEAFRRMKGFVEDAEEFYTESVAEKEVKEHLNAEHSFQTLLQLFSNHLMFCNSWFLKENESYTMWAGYGENSSPTAIAIQTTIGDLIKSFASTNHQIHIGEIKYKDYEKEDIEGYEDFPSINLNNPDNVLKLFYAPILHKRNIYQEEKEVRAIISFETICGEYLDRIYTSEIPFYSDQLSRTDTPFFRRYDTNLMKDIPKKGISLKNNLQTLLKTIVISPNAKGYFHDPFQDLIEYYGINPDIVSPSEI